MTWAHFLAPNSLRESTASSRGMATAEWRNSQWKVWKEYELWRKGWNSIQSGLLSLPWQVNSFRPIQRKVWVQAPRQFGCWVQSQKNPVWGKCEQLPVTANDCEGAIFSTCFTPEVAVQHHMAIDFFQAPLDNCWNHNKSFKNIKLKSASLLWYISSASFITPANISKVSTGFASAKHSFARKFFTWAGMWRGVGTICQICFASDFLRFRKLGLPHGARQ